VMTITSLMIVMIVIIVVMIRCDGCDSDIVSYGDVVMIDVGDNGD
jgi:hypothetical protein